MMAPTAILSEVAAVNPRGPRPPMDETISFVGMADLSAETGVAGPGLDRPFGEVSKGYTIFRDHDVLVAKITPCFENGKTGQAKLARPIGVGSTEFHVVRPDPDRLDARYVLHFLRQERVRLDGERRMTGSAGQRRVPTNFLSELRIPVPPIEEQRRIAAILDHADALRAKRRQVLAHLDDLRQAIFHALVPAETAASRPLESWLDPNRPLTYGILMPGPDVPRGVPYVRVADIQGGQVLLNTVRRTTTEIATQYRRSTLQPGDLVMSIRGHVGRFAEIPESLAGANITQDSARMAIANGVPAYVRAALETPRLQHWLARRTKGAAVRGINLGDLRNAPIPDMPLTVQIDFSERVASTHRIEGRARQYLVHSDSLFKSLQARAFRGEL